MLSKLAGRLASAAFVGLTLTLTTPIAAQQPGGGPLGFTETPNDDIWRYQAVESRWIEQQQERARTALEGRSYDVLIVPVQARGHSFDASERSLITLSLAHAINTRSSLSVADPVLVAQALGLFERNFEEEAIDELANMLGVGKIVVMDIGHNGQSAFRLRMLVAAPGDALSLKNEDAVFQTLDVPFNDLMIPLFGFGRIREEFETRISSNIAPVERPVFNEDFIDFPADANALAAEAAGPDILAVHYLQFLGVLGSRDVIERSRDMLFERSFVLLDAIDRESAHYELLLSRALFYMNRRPAALVLLGEPDTPAERAFFEFLNGNSIRLEEALDEIESPLLRAIATIESERLRYTYAGAPDSVPAEQALDSHEVWGPMLYTAMLDENVWQDHSTVRVKLAADQLFPVERFSLETLVASRLATGDSPTEYEVAEMTFRHLADVDRDNAENRHSTFGPRASDLTDMLRTQLSGQIRGAISYWRYPQSRPRDSINLADEFEPLMSGHPSYYIATSYSLIEEAKNAREPESSSLADRGNLMMRQAVQITQGLYEDTVATAMDPQWAFPEYVGNPPDINRLLLHTSDWPWPAIGLTSGPGQERAISNYHCVNYSHWNIFCLIRLDSLYGNSPQGRQWLAPIVAGTENRYLGSPRRAEFFAGYHLRNGDTAAAEAVYDEAIESGSREWIPYDSVARQLVRELKYAEALDLIQQYPGFSDRRIAGAVQLSNRAYDFGSIFFWTGQYEHAVPLYELSSSYQSGSGAGMTSEVRLGLIRGDYQTAILESTNRIRRYDNDYARRDLMGLSIITGAPGVAQAVANGALENLDSPAIWDGLLVVHRSQNDDIDERMRWSVEEAAGDAGEWGLYYALRYSLLAATTDRDIPSDFPDRYAALDPRDPPQRMGDGGILLDGERYSTPTLADHRLPTGPDEPTITFDRIRVYAARGITALNNGDYEAAFAAFDRATEFHHLAEYLPYYALASALVGDTARVEVYLSRLQEQQLAELAEQPRSSGVHFHSHLAEAALSGAAGLHEDAVQSLRLANADHLLTQHRSVYSRYQIMEIARILYVETNDERYREFALDLARRGTVIEPTIAYTHSFVAMLSPNRDERIESLARVLVLDPQSRSIARADEEELAEAREIARRGYPLHRNRIEAETVAAIDGL